METCSGIANRTRAMVDATQSANPLCQVALTRKHFPGAKRLSLYAVTTGGGILHRSGLSESILVFDAHRVFLTDPIEAMAQMVKRSPERRVAVEVDSPEDGLRYLDAGADIIQCEKFEVARLAAFVARVRATYPERKVIATGGINATNAATFAAHRERLAKEGHKVYDIPVGGSTPRGAAGFAEGFIEIQEQAEACGLKIGYLCTATGSTGTLAGLTAGKILCGNTTTKIHAYEVGKKDPVEYPKSVAKLANDTLELIGEAPTATPECFHLSSAYVGPGYEKPYKEANDDIRLLARVEGIFTDPVYSGKAFHGMLDEIRKGIIPQGSTVVYLHTGGTVALFSEPEIIGDLNEDIA